MAIYRNGASGKISLFVMEPEDEVQSIRFINQHKPGLSKKERRFWLSKTKVSLSVQAAMLGLTGGYNFGTIETTTNKEIL